jgi:hypothetical protein
MVASPRRDGTVVARYLTMATANRKQALWARPSVAAAAFTMASFLLFGCGDSSTNASGTATSAFTCGTQTCDPVASYCAMERRGKELVPAGCKALPSGCKAPKTDASCQPRSAAECIQSGGSPSDCTKGRPECSAQTTCDCIQASKDCPQVGAIATSCKGKDNHVSFACYKL